jgi:superoxide dismutase, Cu-Zn family
MRKMIFVCVILCSIGVVAALAETAPAAKEAVAVINSASGSSVTGVLKITQEGSTLSVVADIQGLPPNSKHGFHIHEFGDCSAPDATSAGSHYDPMGTKHHGMLMDKMKHAGDMGNIDADANGKAHVSVKLEGVSINGPEAPVLGRAVIIHAKEDDASQPVGNAGGRIGCGVIGIAKPK